MAKKKTTRTPRTNPDPLAASEGTSIRPQVAAARPQVVRLDERKLTKKQQEKVAVWQGEGRVSALDTYFQGALAAARKEFGHNAVMAGSASDHLVVGIPCPALPFEYLIGQSVFPLSLIMQINGPPGSLKSSLLYEIFRWFRMAGGGAILNENETKFAPDLARSIIRYREGEVGLILNRCTSVESWQTQMTYWIQKLQKDFTGTKDNPGPGRTVPVVIGVDSIMGKLSEESQEKIGKDGSAGRAFPIEALSITNYMKTVPQWIDGWPFALILNNHLKMGQDDKGNQVRRTAGGVGVNFQESFEIETKVSKSRLKSASWEGRQIRLRCEKNSFAPGHRSIETRMLWWHETNPQTGEQEQVTVWDWDWATVKMLYDTMTYRKGRELQRLRDLGFHIAMPKVSDVENTAWSKNLGMTEADALPWSDVGRMLREDESTLKIIRQALGITMRPLLDGDFKEQLDKLAEQTSDGQEGGDDEQPV